MRYAQVYSPSHPRANASGRVYEHVLVVEAALGHYLPDRAIVHHVDLNGLNNANSNLVACEDQSYHMLLHIRLRALDACGNPNWRKCIYCKRYDDPANLRIAPKNDSGMPYHSCCHADYERERLHRSRAAAA